MGVLGRAPGPEHFVLGLADLALQAWRVPLLAPVRLPATVAYRAVARRGMGRGEALAGRLTEQMTSMLVDQEVVERAAAELLRGDTLEHVLVIAEERHVSMRLADSDLARAIVDALLESDDFHRIVGTAARSVEVREALQAQSSGLADEVAEAIRGRTSRMDDALERTARRLVRRQARASPAADSHESS